MRQNWLFGLIVALNACGSMPEHSISLPGTIQTAQQLTLGFGAGYDDTGTMLGVNACLNISGICVAQATVDWRNCRDYSGAEFTIDGITIPQADSGGYDGTGCTYPTFKAQIPSHLLMPSGPHQLTLRIARETVSLAITEMFENRHIALMGGKLVGASAANVIVQPRPTMTAEHGTYFIYDVDALNDQWCLAKNGAHGFDSRLARIPPAAWHDQGFSFLVPTNMPSGLGTLIIDDAFSAKLLPCPFAECRVSVGHENKIDDVEVIQP